MVAPEAQQAPQAPQAQHHAIHLHRDKGSMASISQEIQLDFNDVTFTVPERRKGGAAREILKGVSGRLRPRRLTAVLGPSGAGKSSLLDILCGNRKTGVTGQVLVNGCECPLAALRQQCVLVSQELALLGRITVRETLKVAADLKLDRSRSDKDRSNVALDIAGILGLDGCLDTCVDRLSGGEKKRLSIGVELVTNPPVMFFDEPTSGLDSVSSLQVISHLQSLSRAGRTIVVVLHQPSSRLFQLFDDILVMGKARTLYYGPTAEMAAAFSAAGYDCPTFYNIADYVVEVASGEHGRAEQVPSPALYSDQLPRRALTDKEAGVDETDAMLSKLDNGDTSVVMMDGKLPQRKYPISLLLQFVVLFKRSLLVTWRDINIGWLRFAAHVGVGVMLGCLYKGVGNEASKVPGNVSCLFFFVMFLFYSNAMPTVLTFPLEAKVFLREYSNNWYSLISYYLSKVCADMPLLILNPTIFLLVAYYLTEQSDEKYRLCMVWLICVLTVIVAHSFGLVMGAAVGMELGVFLVPASTIPLILFSGFFLYINDIPPVLRWLSYVSNFRYGFEGVVISVYGQGRQPLHCSQPYCHWKSPSKFLADIGMANADYWFDVAGLLGWFVFLQLALLATLKVRVHLSRR